MIKMVDVGAGVRVLQTLTAHDGDVTTCDFGAKFTMASGSSDKSIIVWEWAVGKGFVKTHYSPLKPHKYAVTCVKFSPQGTMLATSSIDGNTLLWNVVTGLRVATFVQPNGVAVRTCRFSPDSSSLATADDDGAVAIWDLVKRNLVRTIQHWEGSTQAIAFTHDSKYLVTSCTQGALKLWDMHEGDVDAGAVCLATVDDAHDLGVMACDFSTAFEHLQCDSNSGDDYDAYTLASGGNDELVKLWLVKIGRREKSKNMTKPPCEVQLKFQLAGHNAAVSCVQFSPGGFFLASASIDKTTRIWELGGTCLAVLEGHTRSVFGCSFSRDGGMLATGSNDRSLIVWDLTRTRTLKSVLTPPISASSSQYNLQASNAGPCGRSEREVLRHVEQDTNEVKLLQRIEGHTSGVNSVHFHANDTLATAGGDKLIRMWHCLSDKKFKELAISPIEGHRYTVNQVEFSPNGGDLLASCSLDGTTVLWNAKTGKRARPSFQTSSSGIRTCRFSPDGHLLATAGDDEITSVFDTRTVLPHATLSGHSDAVVGLAFTSDSQYLATASSDGRVNLWSVAPCSDTFVLSIEAHDLGAQSCDFSPECFGAQSAMRRYLLASCGNDSLIKLWHLYTPRFHGDSYYASSLHRTLSGHGGNVMCVRLAPGTGDILGSTATDQTARLWNTSTGECIHVLEQHSSMVNACAFSADSSLFATGSMDKTVLVWQLPMHLVFQTVGPVMLRGYRKRLRDWSLDDLAKWLAKWGLSHLSDNLPASGLDAGQLLTLPTDKFLDKLGVQDEVTRETVAVYLSWLRKEDSGTGLVELDDVQVPHEFLCPITQEIMRDPVTCADGFTYERAAINEWFLSGKFTSPMTNARLTDTNCTTNRELLKQICRFLYGDGW